MSSINVFVIKSKKEANIQQIYNSLYNYMKDKKYGIIFEPKGYNDDFLESIKCEKQYFVLTDSDSCIECGDIFSTVDSFEYARMFSKKQFSNNPRIDYGDYYKISDGLVLLYPEGSETRTVPLFFIEATSPDSIYVLCYKNERSYMLYRQ